jgi:hypothetical protein
LKILATVEYAHQASGGAPLWCKVKPIARVETSRWEWIANPGEVFPTKGVAFWPPPLPPDALIGSLWIVEVEETHKDDASDRLSVRHAEPVTGFVVVEGENGSHLRRSIAEGSFRLHHNPPTRIFLSRPGRTGEWVGPFTTQQIDQDRRWKLDEVAGGFVDLIEVPEDDLVTLRDHSLPNLRVLKPHLRVPLAKGRWNVQNDSTLVSSLLKNVRRLDPEVAAGLNMTQKVWRAYGDALTSGGEADTHDVARFEAIEELLARHEADLTRNRVFLDALLEHPALSDRIEEGVQARVEAAREEIEERAREVEGELVVRDRDLRKELDHLQSLVELRTVAVEELGRSVEAREAALAKVEDELESKIQSVFDEIADNPLDRLVDGLVVRLLVRAADGGGRPRVSRSSDALDADPGVDEVSDADGLVKVLGNNAIALGFDHLNAFSVVGGWLNGRFVACRGQRAFDLLAGTASLLAGGGVWATPIPARIFGVGDVLALPCSRIDGRGPATRLGDLLSWHNEGDYPVAIILQGVNRAPPSHLLEDLLSATNFGEGVPLPWNDGSEARSAPIHRPPRTLWCGTITTGRTCFPVDPALSRRLHLIDADRVTGIPRQLRPRARQPSRVSRAMLYRWSKDAAPPDSLPPELEEFAEEIGRMHLFGEDKERIFVEWLLARAIARHPPQDLDRFAKEVGGTATAYWEELKKEGVPERVLKSMTGAADA